MYANALAGLKHSICYAVKANSNVAVLKILAEAGAGMDVVSIGEYLRARKAGVPGSRIVFSGVGKTKIEIEEVILGGVRQVNVESESELYLLNHIAEEMKKVIPISFRINPDVDAKTHYKISTGKLENKFGIPISEARRVYRIAAEMKGVDIVGVDFHIGSQLIDLEPYKKSFVIFSELVKVLRADGHQIKRLDVGGGLGISYKRDSLVPTIVEYAELIWKMLGHLDCEIDLEPGRSIVGDAGLLVCSTIYLKESDAKNFLIVDGAMNDLARPALYDAYHEIINVKQNNNFDKKVFVDVVGPVCETGDTLGTERYLSHSGEKNLIAICSAGAYGAVMASEYNTRPLVPEVLVKGDEYRIIRGRPSLESIIARDIVPIWSN